MTLNETLAVAYSIALPAMILVVVIKVMWEEGSK